MWYSSLPVEVLRRRRAPSLRQPAFERRVLREDARSGAERTEGMSMVYSMDLTRLAGVSS